MYVTDTNFKDIMKCIAGLNARRRLQHPCMIIGSFKKVYLERLKGDSLGEDFHSA